MQEYQLRRAIVEEAESWIGTPYHANAMVKGGGVDCLRLPLGVAINVGLFDHDDGIKIKYSPQQSMHHPEELCIQYLVSCGMREISENNIKPGDIVLYKVFKAHAHGAIVVDWPSRVIHCVQQLGVIYSHGTQEGFLVRRPRRYFTKF